MEKEKLAQPVIKVDIRPAQSPVIASTNAEYILVALDKDGNEKPGSEFAIGGKTFEKVYRPLCKAPEGDATKPSFMVKKNP